MRVQRIRSQMSTRDCLCAKSNICATRRGRYKVCNCDVAQSLTFCLSLTYVITQRRASSWPQWPASSPRTKRATDGQTDRRTAS